jgi:hypothetical protein
VPHTTLNIATFKSPWGETFLLTKAHYEEHHVFFLPLHADDRFHESLWLLSSTLHNLGGETRHKAPFGVR